MKVKWLRRGLASLVAAEQYVALDNAAAARRMADHIEDAVAQLARFPNLGRAGVRPGTRELVVPRTPYLVVYRVTEKEVQVLRVFHEKQSIQ